MDPNPAKRALRIASSLAADVLELTRVQPSEGLRAAQRSSVRTSELFDLLIDDAELIATSRDLYINGHSAQAVEEAFKYVNNLVKLRTGLTSDGATLMNSAFSPGAPMLKLSVLKTQSQRDQQLGYMMMTAGAMTGVRNPRAHEHRHLDNPRVALELLCIANHLARIIRSATRSRRRKSAAVPGS